MSFSLAERIAWDKKKKEENLEEWKAYHRELNRKYIAAHKEEHKAYAREYMRKRFAAAKFAMQWAEYDNKLTEHCEAAKAQQEVT